MNTSQLAEAIGVAAAAAKPPQEYCLLWINWWPTCMTKSEWSGWLQFVGSILALFIAISIPYYQNIVNRKKNIEMAKQCLQHQCGAITALMATIENQNIRLCVNSVKETLNTVCRSFEMVSAPELSQEYLPTWFAAKTSAEQLKNFADKLPDTHIEDEHIKSVLKSYHENQLRLLSDFVQRRIK